MWIILAKGFMLSKLHIRKPALNADTHRSKLKHHHHHPVNVSQVFLR